MFCQFPVAVTVSALTLSLGVGAEKVSEVKFRVFTVGLADCLVVAVWLAV